MRDAVSHWLGWFSVCTRPMRDAVSHWLDASLDSTLWLQALTPQVPVPYVQKAVPVDAAASCSARSLTGRRLTAMQYMFSECRFQVFVAINDFEWWHHQMEAFSALLAFAWGIHRSPMNSPHKTSDAELWCFLWSAPEKKCRANNQDAGHLRRHRAHYDVTAMTSLYWTDYIILNVRHDLQAFWTFACRRRIYQWANDIEPQVVNILS